MASSWDIAKSSASTIPSDGLLTRKLGFHALEAPWSEYVMEFLETRASVLLGFVQVVPWPENPII